MLDFYLSFTELKTIYLFVLKPESQWTEPPTSGIIYKHICKIRKMLPASFQSWLSGTTCLPCPLCSWLFRKHIKKKIKGALLCSSNMEKLQQLPGHFCIFPWICYRQQFFYTINTSLPRSQARLKTRPGSQLPVAHTDGDHGCHHPQKAPCFSGWFLTPVINCTFLFCS